MNSQMIPLSSLVTSSTLMQIERRKERTEQEISDLAETIIRVGLIHPIIVRPDPISEARMGDLRFEIVAGEGRYLAAQVAGWNEIECSVRELNDEQAEEVQLVENLQRKDLNELVEALGYDALMKRGHSPEEIAERVGKSKRTIYTRLQLLKLDPDAQDALRKGDLSASVALLIARIPGDDQQQRALKHLTEKDWQGRSIGYRDASKYVHDTFMLKLSDAPFPIDDATLIVAAGPCGPCPMRTGNAPDLFDDVKGENVCTNPECFKSKKAAHIKRELEKAKATGDQVIRGAEAKRILPDNRYHHYSSDGAHKHLRNGYARPKDQCLDDPKKRTYAELAGKDAPKVLLQNPDTGRVEKVFKIEEIADQLKAKGIKPAPIAQDRDEARKQDNEREAQRRELEQKSRRLIFQAVVKAAPTRLSREDLAVLVSKCFELGHGDDEEVYATLGWEAPKKSSRSSIDSRQAFLGRLLQQSDAQLAQLAVAMTVIEAATSDYEEPTELEALAKRLGVDVAAIRDATAPTPKKEPVPKAAKKKAAPAKAKAPAKKKAPRKAK